MAGGKTSDGVSGGSELDVKINTVDQRTPLCIGSANEVDRFNKMVLGMKVTAPTVSFPSFSPRE
jgi:sedoheptulose-bisphosphatase